MVIWQVVIDDIVIFETDKVNIALRIAKEQGGTIRQDKLTHDQF